MAKGFIYIFTNPSFPEYVKIGFATNPEQRLEELNRSTAVPFAFRIYATYEVDSTLSDKKLHNIIDKLNPELRSREEVNGKLRTREFYNMTAEDAYDILDAIAEINNCSSRLVKYQASLQEQKDEQDAIENRERLAPFSFDMCEIEPGEELEFWGNNYSGSGKLCKVVDSKAYDFEE